MSPLFRIPSIWEPALEYMESHPLYEEQFIRCVNELFYGKGPLTTHERHYIALMGAARHRCTFLVNLHEREFEACGGKLQWLRGMDSVDDPRMAKLDKLNILLAHQPWQVNCGQIKDLCQGSERHFSLSELTHAVIILSHTHALCSFVEAVAAIPTDITPTDINSMQVRCDWLLRDKENAGVNRKGEVEDLLRRMEQLRAAAQASASMEDDEPEQGAGFENLNHAEENSGPGASGGDSPTSVGDSSLLDSFRRFSDNLTFCYVDFQNRTDNCKTFKIHEFSWEEHGFLILHEFYKSMAPKLEEKFNLTQKLTYKTMGLHEDVDTSAYRMAIWNYIQALFGIRHDDYDYSQVNQLLTREMKTFVKTVACYPHRVTDQLRGQVMTDFKASEKVHVMLMIMEARLQASMLYFTRALANYNVLERTASMQRRQE